MTTFASRPGRAALAQLLYPQSSFYGAKRRCIFWARSLAFGQTYRQALALAQTPAFTPVMTQHPKTLEKAFRPYLRRGLLPQQRLALIAGHYRLLAQHWSSEQLTRFLVEGMTLATLMGPDEQPVLVRLRSLSRFQREGELTIVLEMAGEVFYAATVLLGETPQGQVCLWVGGLQGPAKDAFSDSSIRDLTRQWFGLRPKALMVTLVSYLAEAWGCQQIYAVATEGHVLASRRYRGRDKLKTDYNGLWAESGGQALDAMSWQLPLQPPRKPLEEIASKKRSQYRKRYEWLDSLQEALFSQLTA
ncbi:VirK/YbjX family protein [Gallaecimonas sp. GXIMD1310]|uniref:VirK/YbjX family protein n=1 Tax=Gallaecimonas sp. GXIMD1310 TaxID=3131926 RepID=UPI00324514C6